MSVILTNAALSKLESLDLKEGNNPRIDADIIGGCGVSIKFKLIVDEPRRNDYIVEYNGFKIAVDRFTMRNLSEETQIDYHEEIGFMVGETFHSSTCSIEVDI